jgi:monoamine oxidase
MNENLLYPSGGWHGPKGRAGRRLLRGLDRPRTIPRIHGDEPRGALPDLPRVGRAASPGPVADLRNPVTVAWGLTPWSEGVGPAHPDWGANPRPERYTELTRPEGPIFFAGEHLSYVQFWQEGAALSSHEAMKALQARVQERALSERTGRRSAAA